MVSMIVRFSIRIECNFTAFVGYAIMHSATYGYDEIEQLFIDLN